MLFAAVAWADSCGCGVRVHDVAPLPHLSSRIFPSTLVWQRIMSTKFYVRVIDASLRYLFSWDVANVSNTRPPPSALATTAVAARRR